MLSSLIRNTAFAIGLAAALLATALLATAPPALAQGKPPILIGHVGINSGPAGSYGRMQFIMVQLAADDINAKGGINGSKLVVETADAELDPAKAVLRLRDFYRAGAAAVVGLMSGGQWEATAPLANQLKIPAVTATASKPGITVRPWSLRLGPADDTSVAGAFAAVREKMPNVKKIAILSDMRQASGAAAAKLFEETAAKLGIEVVGTKEFTTGSTDLSPLAISVKSMDVDLIVVNAVIPQALLLANEFRKQGIKTPVLANSFIWPGNFVSAVGEAGANWYTWGWNTNTQTGGDAKLFADVSRRFIEVAGRDPTLGVNIANTTNAYDAVTMIAEIMKAAKVDGATPIEKTREAIKDGFMATREYHGLLNHKITPAGDEIQEVRLLRPDLATKSWKFVE